MSHGSTNDDSRHNPNGAARRRLLKALGLGAVATQIGIDWSKPAIRLGALPAHAEATMTDGCTVAYALTFSSPGNYTAEMTANGGATLTAISTGGGGTQALSASWNQAPSVSSTLGFNYTASGADTLFFTVSAQCCDTRADSYSNSRTGSGANTTHGIYTNDPGDCDIADSSTPAARLPAVR